MSNIKLKDHNWAAEGIYDTNQSKSQQTINSDVSTKIGQATLQTSSQNLSGATNELKGRADTLDSKYDNVVTVANTQPSSEYNKVWLPLTVSEGTQVPTWAEHQALESSLNGAITSLATVISVSQLSDLSGSSSHFVNFVANIDVGAYNIPRYSKGILVASSASDAVLIAVSSIGTIYTAFRSNGTWIKTDLKTYAPVVRSTPVAIPSSSATYTLDGVTGYYHLVSWGFQSSSGNPIPENKAPCDLTWSTANGKFTITKTDDRPLSGQKICPIFEYALDKQAT